LALTTCAARLREHGHDARLMPAKYVRPCSKGQKNDFRDAEAIAEAVQRLTMKFVATKTADQLDLQALHRVRERLVSQRTGIFNQIRAFLLERGVAVRQGLRFVRTEQRRQIDEFRTAGPYIRSQDAHPSRSLQSTGSVCHRTARADKLLQICQGVERSAQKRRGPT
jgi:transposase